MNSSFFSLQPPLFSVFTFFSLTPLFVVFNHQPKSVRSFFLAIFFPLTPPHCFPFPNTSHQYFPLFSTFHPFSCPSILSLLPTTYQIPIPSGSPSPYPSPLPTSKPRFSHHPLNSLHYLPLPKLFSHHPFTPPWPFLFSGPIEHRTRTLFPRIVTSSPIPTTYRLPTPPVSPYPHYYAPPPHYLPLQNLLSHPLTPPSPFFFPDPKGTEPGPYSQSPHLFTLITTSQPLLLCHYPFRRGGRWNESRISEYQRKRNRKN